MASRRTLLLHQRKARSGGNCANAISKLGKTNGFASSHDAKQGVDRCSHSVKGQRRSEQSAVPCGTGDYQNSHIVQGGDTGNFERTVLFLKNKILTVYFEGTVGDQYFELIERMVNQVKSFSSHGSRWIIDGNEKLQISFAAYSPIRAAIYLEQPDALSATLLININTKDDDRCFLYCFVAECHNRNELALYTTSRR